MKTMFDHTIDPLTIDKSYFSLDKPQGKLHLCVEGQGDKLSLSRAIPMLENLGLSIAQCHLSEGSRNEGDDNTEQAQSWHMAFEVQASPLGEKTPNKEIEQFLAHLLSGHAENDILNKLILSSDIALPYIPVLRALTRYLLQIQFNFSIDTLYKCLIKNDKITELFVQYFKIRFMPFLTENGLKDSDSNTQNKNNLEGIEQVIEQHIDAIHSRDDDLICRRYFSVLKAITRTNFYKHGYQQNHNAGLSFKIEPRFIDGIPKPVPAYEIFIYHRFVEGVHLRGGKVSRGGIRFSDRHEDYRTEVLGLVKAQMVKNSVIVPVGAKGGFICKVDLVGASKEDYINTIKAGYEIFIRSLLEITDNRVEGKTVSPEQVVCYDDEDPYLVVAADKGTATFSDFANAIAAEYNYWLGDAFASGGQHGYDHKKMGITAKGAWQSAKRLLIELGKDIDNDPVSVVGIGDMSGDVFGNGMLLSPHIELIAAFNHRHIFIDPTPDAPQSYSERQRLFNLPYSSWGDYKRELLSAGGAIYDRSQKQIHLSAEAATRLGIDASDRSLTPDALIQKILSAKVDMLWNGGIGTYVKASDETDMDASDKANDRVRINATDLQARLVAEGGNLGLTQKARVEYAINGGLIHMDAVDNSAGVDCSDHEVNIKILLEEVLKAGLITSDERNKLLASMAASVSSLVLHNNFRQSKMLSQSNYTAPHFFDSFVQLINLLERDGVLDRELACIPSAEQIDQRITSQESFTRPELATLLAYSKTRLFNKLVDSTLIEDAFFQGLLLKYFPETLVDQYSSFIKSHPLRREILASYVTNDIANRMGATFCNYALEEDSGNITQLVKAHMLAVEIFDVNGLYNAIDERAYQVESQTLLDLQLAIHYPLDKAMNWLIQQGIDGDIDQLVNHYQPILKKLKDKLDNYLPPQDQQTYTDKVNLSVSQGVDSELAQNIHRLDYSYYVLPLANVMHEFAIDADTALHHFFRIGEELNIFWLYQLINHIAIDDNWKRKNKKLLISTIENHHIKALRSFLASVNPNNADTEEHSSTFTFPHLKHYMDMVGLAKAKPTYNFSMVTILASKLGQLVGSHY